VVGDFFDIVMRGRISWQSSNDWVMSGLVSDCAIVMVVVLWLGDVVMAGVVMGVVCMAWLFLLMMVMRFLVSIVMGFLKVSVFMDHIVRLFVISTMLRRSMMSPHFVPVFTLRLNLMVLDMVHVLTVIVVMRFALMAGFMKGFVMSRFVVVIDCFRVGMEMKVGNVFYVLISVVFLFVLVGEGVVLVPVIVVSTADPSGNLVLGVGHLLNVVLD